MEHGSWSCACGEVVARVPLKGNRIVCYCESCQAMLHALGRAGQLDGQGGSELFQVPPAGVEVVQGTDRLAFFRVTEKGPLRWYATCCNTPMVNTLASRNMPFASFHVHGLEPKAKLPEVRARVNLKGATGHVSGARGRVLPLVLGLLGNAAWAHVTRRIPHNPFFDAAGKPVGPKIDPRQELT